MDAESWRRDRMHLHEDGRGKFGHRWEKRVGSFRYHLFPIGSVESLKSAVWRKRLDATSGQRRDNRLSGWFPCILRAVYRWKTNREPKRKGSCTQLPRCDIDFFPFNAHNGLSLSGLKKFQPACCLIPVLVSYFLLFSSFPGNFNSKISNNIRREIWSLSKFVRGSGYLRISNKKRKRRKGEKYCLFLFSIFLKIFLILSFLLFFLIIVTKREREKIFFRTRIRDTFNLEMSPLKTYSGLLRPTWARESL